MSYYKYKDKLVKGLAVLIASILLLGAFAPIVSAEEDEETNLPIEIRTVYPESKYEDDWFDQETLYHDIRDSQTRDRLFLKVVFNDENNDLVFDYSMGLKKLRDFTTVYSNSSNISMIDIEFLDNIDSMDADDKKDFIDKYIFRKGAANKRDYLYIPIKPLMPHMTYSVTLEQGIVRNSDGNENDILTWNFNTMAIPSVSEKDVLVQSVIEDYNVNEPIIINGEFFYSPTVDVYFNDIRAYRIRSLEDSEGEEYLEVYLPRGRNKLDPGLYDITIENSYNHSKWLYGILSVVTESDNKIPEEENKYSTNTPYGNVSEIRRLESIRLDHAEPVKEQILRRQLSQYTLKSPLIQVGNRESSIYTSFALEIPIDSGIYENFRVLRYDETTRIWTEDTSYYVDKVNQRVGGIVFGTGIFVVVEPKY